MRSGKEFVELLDEYLKSKGLTRRQFCNLTDIPESTIGTWKSKNVMPSVELVSKVATFMNVSLDWLVYGEQYENANVDNTTNNPYSRRSIFDRIHKYLIQDYDDTCSDIQTLYKKYLADIVEYEIISNWVCGKANLPEDVLPRIADKLDVSLQYLLSGNHYNKDDFDPQLYERAKKYSKFLTGYSTLEKEEQQFINDYIETKKENYRLKREEEIKKMQK